MKKLLIGLAILSASILRAQNNICFSDVKDYRYSAGLSSGILDMEIRDFNNDGKLDILTIASSLSFEISNGNGDGTFATPLSHSLANTASMVTCADIDADGFIDVAILFGNYDISLLKNLGSNTFSLVSTTTFSYAVNRIEFASLNNDLFPDLLVASAAGNNAFLYQGTGQFSYNSTITFNCGSGQSSFVITDLNNDTKKDLAFLSTNGSINIFYLDGLFGTLGTFSLPGNGPQVGITSGNFNNDAYQDLVTFGVNYPIVALFLNNGQTTGWNTTLKNVKGGLALTVGDWDSNGCSDFATGVINSDVITVVTLTNNCVNQREDSYGLDYSLCNGIWCLESADMNGDGIIDLVGTSYGSRFYCLLGKGNGKFHGVQKLEGYGSLQFILSDDFNNDGKPDVLKYGSNGSIFCCLKTATDFVETYSMNISGGFSSIVTKDMNSDGNVDIILCRNYPYETQVYSGTGTGSFSLATTLNGISGAPRILICKDLNNDGHPEIFASHEFNNSTFVSYYIYKNNGNFSFDNVFSAQLIHESIKIADLNNDSFEDIITLNSGPNHDLTYVMLGNGTINGYNVTSTISAPGMGYSLEIIDLSMDGKLDMVLTGQSGIDIYTGNGMGAFSFSKTISGPFLQTILDLNNDNLPDIVCGQISILQNLGNLNFSTPNDFYINHSVQSVVLADFNGDHLPDILASDLSMCNYDLHYNTSACIAKLSSSVVCQSTIVRLEAISTESYKYDWNPGAGTNSFITVAASGEYTLTSRNLSGSCVSSSKYAIVFSSCTNLTEEIVTANVILYPTISNSSVWLENLGSTISEVKLFSVSGQCHRIYKNIESGKFEIPIEGLANGMYIVNCISDTKNYTFKIVKTN